MPLVGEPGRVPEPVRVRLLPEATVVLPFRLTVPEPVLKLPLLALWSKLPEPLAKVTLPLRPMLPILVALPELSIRTVPAVSREPPEVLMLEVEVTLPATAIP